MRLYGTKFHKRHWELKCIIRPNVVSQNELTFPPVCSKKTLTWFLIWHLNVHLEQDKTRGFVPGWTLIKDRGLATPHPCTYLSGHRLLVTWTIWYLRALKWLLAFKSRHFLAQCHLHDFKSCLLSLFCHSKNAFRLALPTPSQFIILPNDLVENIACGEKNTLFK